MPIQVHNFVVRGNNINASQRMSKEDADVIYKQISEAFDTGKEFAEIKIDDDVISVRLSGISTFGIQTYMEQTKEEAQQIQIDRIKNGYEGYNECSPTKSSMGSGTLIGGW